MAEDAVLFVFKELATFLLSDSSVLGKELGRDVQFILDEVGSMTAFLRDDEAREDESFEHHEWMNQVQEVAHDMQDVYDEFSLQFPHHHHHHHHRRGHVQNMCFSIKSIRVRSRISSKIKNLKSRVIDISERHRRYQQDGSSVLGSGSAASSSVANQDYDIGLSSILIKEPVGIREPKSKLLSEILADDSHLLKVIAVVGMAGVGKTTLVRNVFDDKAVKKRFQVRAWLTISQNFQIVGIIKDLIKQIFAQFEKRVPPEVKESTDLIKLITFARDFLQNQSYIVVADDVWSEASWEAIKHVFPDGGRVILTTRITSVASAACSFGSNANGNYIHQMKALSDEDSWTLFCNRTFPSTNCPPPHLEQVSSRIVKMCEGLPLLIATTGGVLAAKDKNNIGEWEMVLQSLRGKRESGNDEVDRVKRKLSLSYKHLPHHLKSCYSYLSIYPEDLKINVGDLRRSWIALGLIKKNEGVSSYDVADSYIHELFNRNLLQEASIHPCGTLKSCRIHDLLRDIIVSKSRGFNLIAGVTGKCDWNALSDKLRCLGIHDYIEDDDDDPSQQLNKCCFKRLQTLEFLGNTSHVTGSFVSKFLSYGGTKFLKVLNLSKAPLEDIPKEVFNLLHLKHLCLEYTRVHTIPKAIGKLKNLEILDLYGTNVREISVEILKLTKLSCLYIRDIDHYPVPISSHGFKSPDGIGKLLSLEYLQTIEADEDGRIVREIGRMTKLKSLAISKLRREDGKELLSSLVKLTNLHQLTVESITEETLDLEYPLLSPAPPRLKWLTLRGRIERMPEWVKSLQNLTKLALVDSGFKEGDDESGAGIGFVADLSNLLVLMLCRAYNGQELCFRPGGFQKLTDLYIWKLESLKWLKVEDENSLPSLEGLIMVECKEVEELPLGIENLKKLKSVSFQNMSDGFVQKVLNLDEQSKEYQALACVQQVVIKYWKNGTWVVSHLLKLQQKVLNLDDEQSKEHQKGERTYPENSSTHHQCLPLIILCLIVVLLFVSFLFLQLVS